MAWALSIMDPFTVHGAKQPSLFPIQSTTLRMRGLTQVTANANGWAWIYLNPHSASSVITIDVEAATNETPSGMTTVIPRFSTDSTHPLYKADWRVVSAGIRAFLTTPYINSTGMFLGANVPYSGSFTALYDRLGDSPKKVLA